MSKCACMPLYVAACWQTHDNYPFLSSCVKVVGLTSNPDCDKGRLALDVFEPPSSNMNSKKTAKICIIEQCPNTRNMQSFICILITSWWVGRWKYVCSNFPIGLFNSSSVQARNCDRLSNKNCYIVWSFRDLNVSYNTIATAKHVNHERACGALTVCIYSMSYILAIHIWMLYPSLWCSQLM